MKLDSIKKDGRHLKIYFKKRWYERYITLAKTLDSIFDDGDSYLGTSIDITGKYIIVDLLLRSKEDILPYVDLLK